MTTRCGISKDFWCSWWWCWNDDIDRFAI